MKEKEKSVLTLKKESIELIFQFSLYFLISIIFIILGTLVVDIFINNGDTFTTLLVPLGISLSALLASSSLLKSLTSSIENEKTRKDKEEKIHKNKTRIYMKSVEHYLISYCLANQSYTTGVVTNYKTILNQTNTILIHAKDLIIKDTEYLGNLDDTMIPHLITMLMHIELMNDDVISKENIELINKLIHESCNFIIKLNERDTLELNLDNLKDSMKLLEI